MGMHWDENFSSASVNSVQRRSTGFPKYSAMNLSLNSAIKDFSLDQSVFFK